MKIDEAIAIARECKATPNASIADRLDRFLGMSQKDLANFCGSFTEVLIAKFALIMSKRKVVDLLFRESESSKRFLKIAMGCQAVREPDEDEDEDEDED